MRSQIKPTWGISELVRSLEGFPRGFVVKNPPISVGDASSIPGSGRSPGEGNGSILPEKYRAGASGGVQSMGSQESDRLSY